MNSSEIANLEHASRVAMAWSPEGYDGKTHYGPVLMAFVPAICVVLVAMTFLVSVI
jgi:hypothetical protein